MKATNDLQVSKYEATIRTKDNTLNVTVFTGKNDDRVVFENLCKGNTLTRQISVIPCQCYSITEPSEHRVTLSGYNETTHVFEITFEPTGKLTYFTTDALCAIFPDTEIKPINNPYISTDDFLGHRCDIIRNIIREYNNNPEVTYNSLSKLYDVPYAIVEAIVEVYRRTRSKITGADISALIQDMVYNHMSISMREFINQQTNPLQLVIDYYRIDKKTAEWYIWFVEAHDRLRTRACAAVALQGFGEGK